MACLPNDESILRETIPPPKSHSRFTKSKSDNNLYDDLPVFIPFAVWQFCHTLWLIVKFSGSQGCSGPNKLLLVSLRLLIHETRRQYLWRFHILLSIKDSQIYSLYWISCKMLARTLSKCTFVVVIAMLKVEGEWLLYSFSWRFVFN